MSREFTKEQRHAIESREQNLLVSASAGSGKTTVMIERVLSLIEEGASLENMVICTFTRSAAADMRDKLQNALLKRVGDGTAFSEIAERELLLLPTAEISTLHSWCQRLIRNYFYVIGADPAFEIADEDEAETMLSSAIDDTIEEKIASGDEDFVEFYDIMLSGRTDDALKKLIRTVYGYTEAQADPETWLTESALNGLTDPRLSESVIESAVEKLNGQIKNHILPSARNLLVRTKEANFKRNCAAVEQFVDNMETGEDKPIPKVSGKTPDGCKELNEEYKVLKKAHTDVKEKIKRYEETPRPNDRVAKFTRVLLGLVSVVTEKYAEDKRRHARLDYSDLEHLTVKIVENPERAEDIRARYRYIFVDEYQDINPLQERILSALKSASLFLVGDVKQSIYAFRMCDPNIFLHKYAHYEESNFAKPIELNANFRSTTEILDYVNRVFCPLMTEKFGKISYESTARLTSGAGLTGGKVSLNLITKGGRQPKIGIYSVIEDTSEDLSNAEAEANRVVADIAELLESGFVRYKGEDGSDKTRPVEYGDIAVLSATRGLRQGLIHAKLKKIGINASLSDALEFTSVPEITKLTEFMKYIVFGSDDVALVSILLSPIADLTEDELALVRMTGKQDEERFFVLCENYAEKNTDETARKLREFFALCERYRGYARTHSACEFVGKLVAEKNWFPRVEAGDDPDVKTDTLTAFLDHLASSRYGASVYTYVEYLASAEAQAERKPAVDAVNIMTIHASKGLEFPFVFFVDTAHEFNIRETYGRVQLDDTMGVCMKNFDEKARTISENKLTLAAGIKKRRALQEEQMRLLYVAITRSKQGLYIYATVGESIVEAIKEGAQGFDPEYGDCFFDWLVPTFPIYGYSVYRAEDCKAVQENEQTIIAHAPDDEFVRVLNRYYDAPKKNAPKHVGIKKSVTAIGKDAEDDTVQEYMAGADDDRALEKGNAYHRAMEKADYSLTAESAVKKLRDTEPSFALVDEAEFVTAFNAVKNRIGNRKIYREKQFVYNPGGTIIQGVIDLLVTDGKTYEVIDYKTSQLKTIESGTYNTQLAAYALAAEEITGMPVEKVSIYSFRAGRFFDADPATIASIKTDIKLGKI